MTLQRCDTIESIRGAVRAARAAGRTIGIVPTMGNLHAGHASLIDASVGDGHFTVVTIFVNPTQFGPTEDLAAYPRTGEADLALCEAHGAAAAFMPAVEAMYPPGARTSIHVAALTEGLCGASRPGHFDGVCTVVAKLFNIVGPDAAYFGQKDAQQAIVLRRMAKDLDFPIALHVCPTVREADGLAMSSRNQYLTADQRRQATALHGALRLAAERIARGSTGAAALEAAMREHLAAHAPDGTVDYIALVNPEDLTCVQDVNGPVLIALAVKVGRARLIDNLMVDPRDRL
ncbi:MAG: pantoate--beta-alanine ligase [Planctomycetes bacterium]|nr:pantoate--beta-alanine ligase [Planctomycetota bacterium]